MNFKPSTLFLETKTSPSRVEAFIEGKYGTEFASPLIRIDGHHVIVKFRSLKKGADYIGQSIYFVVATSSKTGTSRFNQRSAKLETVCFMCAS